MLLFLDGSSGKAMEFDDRLSLERASWTLTWRSAACKSIIRLLYRKDMASYGRSTLANRAIRPTGWMLLSGQSDRTADERAH